MRDPNRIPEIIAEISLLWNADPDLRLMQLLINTISPKSSCPELYYLEDDELRERLTNHLKRREQGLES